MGSSAKYNASLPTVAEGRSVEPQCDSSGRLLVVSGGGTAPTGSATEAKQDTGNTSLSSIDGKLPTAATPADASAYGTLSRIGALLLASNGSTAELVRTALLGAQSSAVGMLNMLSMRRYNATQPTLTDGQLVMGQCDTRGNTRTVDMEAPKYEDQTNDVAAVVQRLIATNTYAPSLAKDFGTVTKAVVKASAGNVLAVRCSNTNAAVRYLQLHNKATAPAGTEVPIYAFTIPAGTAAVPGFLVLDASFFCGSGAAFATGIGWAISTTAGTFTDSATASEHVVHVHYK